MKGMQVIAALCVIASAASADTVVLENGGTISGTIEEITVFLNGAEKTLHRGEFQGLLLNPQGADTITLADGTHEKGEMLSVRIKSIGGLLTFKQVDVRNVIVTETVMDALRKEYLRRRSKVKEDDAAALYELAVWCKEKKLKAEAHDLATQCLKTDSEDLDLHDRAHRLLGHVRFGNEWVVNPEPDKPKEDKRDIDVSPLEPAPEAGEKKGPDAGLVAQASALIKQYADKAAAAEDRDRNTVESSYLGRLKASASKYKKLGSDLRLWTRRRVTLSDDLSERKRKASETNSNDGRAWSEEERDDIKKIEDDYEAAKDRCRKLDDARGKTKREYAALARRAKAALSVVKRRAARRTQRLKVARSKIDRLIGLGKPITDAQMQTILEKALQDH